MKPRPPIRRGLVPVLAFSCGLSAAAIYSSQPLLNAMARTFGIQRGAAGIIVTITQAGYAAGLILLVPLGDRLNPRRLIAGQLGLLAVAVSAVAAAPSTVLLLGALTTAGLLAVVIQTIVAFAASQATDRDRGTIVGSVTSGVVTGILLARAFAGTVDQILGWRAVYLVVSGGLFSTSLVAWRLIAPGSRGPTQVKESYRQLVTSIASLYGSESLLRRRGALALLCFAAFSTLWTSLVLPLSAAPLGLPPAAIGAFGLVGATGGVASRYAGRLADRGHAQAMTGIALTLLSLAWMPIALLHVSLVPLVVGLVLLDLGVATVHVTSQTLLYATRPDARSRLAAAYMLCYSVGSAGGAIASTAAYSAGGWSAVCALGAGLSLTGLVVWVITDRPRAPAAGVRLPGARRRQFAASPNR